MRYELWEYEGGHTFIEVAADDAAYLDRIRQLHQEEPQAHHVWSVDAKNWNAAMQLLYDRKGWGRYRTIEQDLGEPGKPAGLNSAGNPEASSS